MIDQNNNFKVLGYNCHFGADTKQVQINAYALLKTIDWPSAYYRNDIGFKEIDS